MYNTCIIYYLLLHINESMNFKVSYYDINIHRCINNTRNLRVKYVMRKERSISLISEEYS